MVIKHTTHRGTPYPLEGLSRQISQNQTTLSSTLLVNMANDAQYTKHSKLRRALRIDLLAQITRSIQHLLRLAVGRDHQT